MPSNIAVHRAKHTTARSPLSPLSSRSDSSDNADYNADLAQKKQEAAESFIQYNDGTWSGRAVIFSVPQTLSNEKSRADSISHASYTLTSSTDITSSGISQKSTLQWSSTSLSSFSRYTTLLSGNTGFDVDSVDGSYSADHSLLDLNLPSTNLLGSFAIETSIAVTDSRRIRSILLYNFSKTLSRIILFDESKKDTPTTSSSTTTLQQEITNTISNLGEDGNTDRMKKIQAAASLGAQKAQLEAKSIAEDSNDRVKVSTFQPNLRRLCSGVWEGDGVLRNHNSPIPLKNKGEEQRGAKRPAGTTIFTVGIHPR
ncbi:hypothetical protein TL16_g04360 [Triparma laevis f. inornata]|uniref:Uncharacterized protein n=1 Tax=Triparma laevis f. inornata TaxID=1714386 RepID=A0A9W7AE72_9STRA|nr:hypothetical protein TL16_g04360 [Triparma laevis f. inornata]